MADNRRDDEPSRHHFRSERVVLVNGAWYIATREGIEVGPYSTRPSAEAGAKELGEMLAGVDDVEIAKLFIREFRRRRDPSS